MEPVEKPSSVITFLAGLVTVGFVMFMCALIWRLAAAGVPDEDRAELISTLAIATVGLVISAVVTARATSTNPLEFIGQMLSAVRQIARWKR